MLGLWFRHEQHRRGAPRLRRARLGPVDRTDARLLVPCEDVLVLRACGAHEHEAACAAVGRREDASRLVSGRVRGRGRVGVGLGVGLGLGLGLAPRLVRVGWRVLADEARTARRALVVGMGTLGLGLGLG